MGLDLLEKLDYGLGVAVGAVKHNCIYAFVIEGAHPVESVRGDAYAGGYPEAARRARRRAWLELCIGVPAFIGVIYLVIYLIRALRGG